MAEPLQVPTQSTIAEPLHSPAQSTTTLPLHSPAQSIIPDEHSSQVCCVVVPPQTPAQSTMAEPLQVPAQSNTWQLTGSPMSEQLQSTRRARLRIVDERYLIDVILVGKDSWMQVRITPFMG
jgi:hypothetical protein